MSSQEETNTPRERGELFLREKDAPNSPSVLKAMQADLRQALSGVLSDASCSGRKWLRGKSGQEVARVEEILSNVTDRIGRLLLDEEEQRHRHRIEDAKAKQENNIRQDEHYLSSLKEVVEIVKGMRTLGVDVDINTILSKLAGFAVSQESIELHSEPPVLPKSDEHQDRSDETPAPLL